MQQQAWLFFVLFALILAGMYLSIRRQWLAPGLTAAAGVIASIVLMTLTSLGQGNMPVQAVIVGILLGGLFSGATLAIAWYFQRAEVQKRYSSGVPTEEAVVEHS
jgi:CDP-diglyceride synthetase